MMHRIRSPMTTPALPLASFHPAPAAPGPAACMHCSTHPRILIAQNTKLIGLPVGVGGWGKVVKLNFKGNAIAELPPEIQYWKCIQGSSTPPLGAGPRGGTGLARMVMHTRA